MSELVDRYRRYAEKCLLLASTSDEPESRKALLGMANVWLALAARRAKNLETELGNEPPPPLRPLKPDDPMQC